MAKVFLSPLRWQFLGCVVLALFIVGVAIAVSASEARGKWENLREQHIAWASSPMKVTCDALWEKYEQAPGAIARCSEPSGPKLNEPSAVNKWRCEQQATTEAAAVEAKLRDSICVNPYSGFGSSRLSRYSPADPGPYEPWAYEHAFGGQVKALLRLALATAFGGFCLLLLGRLFITEHHIGWRRAAVVVSGLVALGTSGYLAIDAGRLSERDALELLVSAVGIFLASLMALLFALRIQRWIAQGFAVGPGGMAVPIGPGPSAVASDAADDASSEEPRVLRRPIGAGSRSRDGSPAMTIVGFLLLCLAFGMPVLGALLGAGNSVELSRSVPQQLGSLLVIGGISFLVTRNRSERAKSLGTLVVGVLMCLVAFVNLQDEVKQVAEGREFFRKALTWQQERKASFAEFSRRFERLDLASILTPETMSQPAARAQGRARLAQYRALLAERRALLQTHFQEAERFIGEHAPAFGKTIAFQALRDSSSADVVRVYDKLHQTQSALADAMAEMLDWTEHNQGKVQFEAGKARFATPAAQAEFSALVNKLKQLEAAVEVAVREGDALQSNAEAVMERNTATMERLAK